MSNEKPTNQKLDMAAIREKLAEAKGPRYWRTFQELAETPEFMEILHDEVPQITRSSLLSMDRKQFLTLGAASIALAGVSGCRYLPQKKSVPYVVQPEIAIPEIPLFYASSAPTVHGFGIGTMVTSHQGRPTKIDGNPAHPASLGALDSITQASVLTMYDPDRAQSVMQNAMIATWDDFFEYARPLIQQMVKGGGSGLRFLSQTSMSPTFLDMMSKILKIFPNAQWAIYDPMSTSPEKTSELAYGKPVHTYYDLTKARRIVSLDADFLTDMPGSVRYARDFMDGRRVRAGIQPAQMNRLYSIESAPTTTGAVADHLLRVRASEIPGITLAIAAGLGVPGVGTPQVISPEASSLVSAIVADLLTSPSQSLIIPGAYQDPSVFILAQAINDHLGSTGSAVIHTELFGPPTNGQGTVSLAQLVSDMNSGTVEMLLILGGNPCFDAPSGSQFTEAMSKVTTNVHFGMYEDETTAHCEWHLPESHFLESWGDIRAYDGTASIIQPLIEPLYHTKNINEVLSGLFDFPYDGIASSTNLNPRNDYHMVRDYWAKNGIPERQEPFDFDFKRVLHDGVIANSAAKPIQIAVSQSALSSLKVPSKLNTVGKSIEIMLRPDPTMWDGRFANNGWLQELPKPFTKVTWDNIALMSPGMAEKLNIPINQEGAQASPLIEISASGQTVKIAVWTLPGHAEDAITVYLGYGRTIAGHVGSNTGFNIYPILFNTAHKWNLSGDLSYNGDSYDIATTQHFHTMDGRDIIHAGTIAQFLTNPSMTEIPLDGQPPSENDMGRNLQQPDEYPRYNWPTKKMIADGDAAYAYAWGMSIDLSVCTSCSACMMACQSENNIAIVGKNYVMRGRHMNWIRVDTYYESKPDDYYSYVKHPKTYFQPVTCMQCEQAPCEPVCPVGATMHSEEGINQMVYNRCIGTRYCSNNCPYKVRRFNYINYSNHFDANKFGQSVITLEMVNNPDVTVRGRGVMEKCMFCIQRINFVRQRAEVENRPIRDGEVVTACQQACPTNAIVFGNINDPEAEVTKLKHEPHNYGLLADLNTRPRLTYLAKVSNPNPLIKSDTEQSNG